jgi:hypothetical protein
VFQDARQQQRQILIETQHGSTFPSPRAILRRNARSGKPTAAGRKMLWQE